MNIALFYSPSVEFCQQIHNKLNSVGIKVVLIDVQKQRQKVPSNIKVVPTLGIKSQNGWRFIEGDRAMEWADAQIRNKRSKVGELEMLNSDCSGGYVEYSKSDSDFKEICGNATDKITNGEHNLNNIFLSSRIYCPEDIPIEKQNKTLEELTKERENIDKEYGIQNITRVGGSESYIK